MKLIRHYIINTSIILIYSNNKLNSEFRQV